MNHKNYAKIVMLIIATLFIAPIFNSGALSQNRENLTPVFPLDSTEGHFLYTPWHSKTTYLINETGAVNHTWQSTYYPLYDSYMGDNGSIYLAIDSGQGGVQKIAYDGTILWEYHYTLDSSYATHDIVPLPTPPLISGPANGTTTTNYAYTFISFDTENITYEIDWGDETPQHIATYPAGQYLGLLHQWNTPGVYTITVTASDGPLRSTAEQDVRINELPIADNLILLGLALLALIAILAILLYSKKKKNTL